MLSLPAGICSLLPPSAHALKQAANTHLCLRLRGLQEPQCVHWDIACILQARVSFWQQRILSILLQSTRNTNIQSLRGLGRLAIWNQTRSISTAATLQWPPALLEHRCCCAPRLCSIEVNAENCIAGTKAYKARRKGWRCIGGFSHFKTTRILK